MLLFQHCGHSQVISFHTAQPKRPKRQALRWQKAFTVYSQGSPERSRGSQAKGEKQLAPQLDLRDPSQAVVWGGQLPSRRRAVVGGLSGLAIVLVGNLGGVTGALLGWDDGVVAGGLHLDVLYPVKGFKRCVDGQNGFEFRYPASWLADQRMFRQNAERREQLRDLDPPSVRLRRRNPAEPVAAFGPAGSSGELNISVIVAPIQEGFQLKSLGGAKQAGERFLSTTITPPGSGLETHLITATERTDETGQLYYTMEYTVRRPDKFFRHNVSVYAARNGLLYTLNAQSPETAWQDSKEELQKAGASFRVNRASALPAGLA